MKLNLTPPKKSLNKAYLKEKVSRNNIELFKKHLTTLLQKINEEESEEHLKNLVSDFLKDTWYKESNEINTKDRKDLVVHLGKTTKDPVGVVLEVKRPSNKSEMISEAKPNTKALHELVLYYLRERVEFSNIDMKYLIITNIYEWYIIDEVWFENNVYRNTKLKKDYENWKLSGNDTKFFYENIAKPFIESVGVEINCTYFDIRNYEKALLNTTQEDDNTLITLFKILSPTHLLKQSFANDSNSLDKTFYSELLYLIGLVETKDGSKKLIQRNAPNERNSGSILENAISQLDSLDKIGQLNKPNQFGATNQDRLFNVGLELCITWINRILFLKLLEAQLIKYHRGDKSWSFLNIEMVQNFDDLNSLFFSVLAKLPKDRLEDLQKLFKNVPYLNSSLFEPTDVEHQTIFISNLREERKIPLLVNSVLRKSEHYKKVKELNSLEYLFEFLSAYDFSSEGSEAIEEENKTLINASVLGLIFEKINGYKDGSFFTPGFITMYMCRETIRKAVLKAFNDKKSWNCSNFNQLYDKIDNRSEANEIINNLRICDPAVGSGHFLVSALNEIIAIKSDLNVLLDREGRRLKEYEIEVVNDELIITDEDGELYEYKPSNKESQRVQETLFHEKQTIIEQCLFGVDINPNSVKICRLRLWIELLKNAYYKPNTNYSELETLPNIDINIKCGNSLISRFSLEADLKQALKKSKWTIDTYKLAVHTYHNAQNKEEKRTIEKLILDIKKDFQTEISDNDPRKKRLAKLKHELFLLADSPRLEFQVEMTKGGIKIEKEKIKKISDEIDKLEQELKDIENNKIYENAFEWRFEFPEILNNDGDFEGFDVIIGNPPYLSITSMDSQTGLDQYQVYNRGIDIYCLFYEQGFKITKPNGVLGFITSNKWMNSGYGKDTRQFFTNSVNPTLLIDFPTAKIFENATVFTNILVGTNKPFENTLIGCKIEEDFEPNMDFEGYIENKLVKLNPVNNESWKISDESIVQINRKIEAKGVKLKDWKINFFRGITTGYNDAFHISNEIRDEIVKQDKGSKSLIKPLLRGRDIKRYKYKYENTSIIFTRKGIDIDLYPGIKEHLFTFHEELKPRNNKEKIGRKPGNYKWFEIQDNTAYYKEFEKDKIVWLEISDRANFCFDNEGMYLTNSAYFISGDNLKYLLAVLNSRLSDFYFFQITAQIAGGRKRYTKQFVEQIPVPQIDPSAQIPFIKLVDLILAAKKENPEADTTKWENEIDSLVYGLYGLTKEEIKTIEQ
jgi:adenine-specific DNA-methyltransferase